ncbi:MAG: hypothetical protein K9W46_00750 [Candidatus Heimdallarchaeum endolithica]|uniref:Transmembrane protein n=1 Tax=Candidatus Heimdallarchaeum endolithica TaxID=2876572 RepID=A0A9Y1BR62_9ARCH|nr:MAG: hypothetical protein K9W46_00750 [Candidatus Heimdallarchaeum endolithica]
MDKDYKSEQRGIEKRITFRRDDMNKNRLFSLPTSSIKAILSILAIPPELLLSISLLYFFYPSCQFLEVFYHSFKERFITLRILFHCEVFNIRKEDKLPI